MAFAEDFDLVEGGEGFRAHQDGFHLGGEDIDAADDEHVIGAPGDPVHAHMGPSALAGLGGEHRDIPGAVAQDGEGFLGQGGEHQFPFLAVGQGQAAVLIDAFHQEVVFPHMQALAGDIAFDGDAGAHHFGQAVDVDGIDAETGLDFIAHFLAPGLGAEDAHPQRQLADVDAELFGFFGDVEGVGGSTAKAVHREILHQHDLLVGLAAGHGHHHHPQLFAAIVEAEAAGEQAVAEADLQALARMHAGRRQRAGHQFGPVVDIAPGVADHGGLAGGARGGMDPDNLFGGDREHAEGIVVAQLFLLGEGQQAGVGKGLDVVRAHPQLIHRIPVELDRGVAALDGGLQTAELKGRQLFPGQGFEFGIEDHGRSFERGGKRHQVDPPTLWPYFESGHPTPRTGLRQFEAGKLGIAHGTSAKMGASGPSSGEEPTDIFHRPFCLGKHR